MDAVRTKKQNRVISFFQRLGERTAALFTRPRYTLLLCFLIPFLLLMGSHAFLGVYPFGPLSVLALDLNGQYVYFFSALRDCVYGEGSLLYSFVRGMGGEFMGIYAYYLASPLSYLVCLFPKESITEALYLLLSLKAGLCGLSFGILTKKTTRLSSAKILLLSSAYALSGYVTAQQTNTMWIDAVYLLPLIVYGMIALIQNRHVWLYTLSLAATLLFNYYIGYMSCIFLLLAFFAVYFGMSRRIRNPLGERAHLIKTLLRMGLYSLCAILIAAVILIPAGYSLSFGKDEFTNPTYSFEFLYEPLRYFAKFLFGSYDSLKPEGLPMVYAGLLSLLLFPLFFLARRVPVREKLAGGLLFCALFFISNIKAFDLLMHGGQMPNWMNCRYSFCIIFVMLFCVARLLSHTEEMHPAVPLVSGGALTLFTASLFLFANADMSLLIPLCVSVPLMVGYSVLLFFYCRQKGRRTVIGASLLVLTVVELLASAIVTLYLLHYDVGISWRYRYTDMEERFQDVVDYVRADDPDLFYRMEKMTVRKLNDGYQFGYYGLSGSTSTLNRSQIDFLRVLGYTADSIYTQYCYPNPAQDMLLGVRYVLAEPRATVSPLYRLRYAKIGGEILKLTGDERVRREETEDGERYTLLSGEGETPLENGRDVLVYENPYALSLGFGVEETAGDITFVQPEVDRDGNWLLGENEEYCSIYEGRYKSAFERLNRIYQALTGDETLVLFRPITHRESLSNVKTAYTYRTYKKENAETGASIAEYFRSKRYDIDDESQEGTVSFTFEGVKGEHIYMYIPAKTFKEASFTVNGTRKDLYFSIFHFGIYDLGEFEEGESVTVSFTVGDEGLYMGRELSYFYSMSEAAVTAAYDALSATGLSLTSFDGDRFTATADGGDFGKQIMTTIPYDAGWHVKVDGVTVETEVLLDACLAFRLPAGEHTVEFIYYPDCYGIAVFLSGFGTALFLAAILCRRKKRCARHVLKASEKGSGTDENE